MKVVQSKHSELPESGFRALFIRPGRSIMQATQEKQLWECKRCFSNTSLELGGDF